MEVDNFLTCTVSYGIHYMIIPLIFTQSGVSISLLKNMILAIILALSFRRGAVVDTNK